MSSLSLARKTKSFNSPSDGKRISKQTLKITNFLIVGIICNLLFSTIKCVSKYSSFTKYVQRDYASMSGITKSSESSEPTSAGFACTRASMCRVIHGVCVRENFNKYFPTRKKTLIRVT